MSRSPQRLVYEREYYQKHKEKIQENARARRLKNRDSDRKRVLDRDRDNWEYKLFRGAKQTAKNKHLVFNLDISDISIPDICPILGVKLLRGNDPEYYPRHKYTASLDRINPKEGYIKGNIWVISWLANKMKQDADSSDLSLFCRNILQLIKDGKI